MDTFQPSINWGHELIHSLVWVATVWTISALCVITIAFALIRCTVWGERFWRISGSYFGLPHSLSVWMTLGVLLLSVILAVRMEVLVSYYNNDLYSALQAAFQRASSHSAAQHDSGVSGFWFAMLMFGILAVIRVARTVFDTFLTQRFIINWRVWLTNRMTTDWLDANACYRGRFVETRIDNPDQRLQEDIDVVTTGVGTGPNVPTYYTQSILLFGAADAVVSVASFTVILWSLSGPVVIFGLQLHRALFCVVLAYAALVSVIAFWIGRPLIDLSYHNEKNNAAFRYALARLRGAAEAASLYRGSRAEREQLDSRFTAVITNYRRYVRHTLVLVGWNYSATVAIVPLPFIVQAPRLFAGAIKLGDVMQSATAFGKVQSGLSFFRNAYSQFASYNAAINRLYGLLEANAQARRLPMLTAQPSHDGAVELHGIGVSTPTGTVLINGLSLRLEPGESMTVVGPSGSGKTTLLRSLAELWPAASGYWRRPGGMHETMFLSQLPYMPLGDLRAAICYPVCRHEVDDDRLRGVLAQVSLPHLEDQLDSTADWSAILSPGEQQRIAFARILLTAPKAVFLDEATSALDEGLERAMYLLLRTELPNTIIVSVSHDSSLEQLHDRQLHLLGDGGWTDSVIGGVSVSHS